MSRRIFVPTLHSIFSNANRCNSLGNCGAYSDYHNRVSNYRIEEDDKNYIIEMDMPGVKKEDLEIGIKENILSISAKRKKAVKTENGESKEEVISSYEQSFNISTKGIDVENIAANLNNGVLMVTLPKKEELKYEKKIEIKGE
ncbi:Hsp20/alpha crystallin family protein [Brachyspira hampsonii]|uniref:Putative molecular chaperone, IbpA (Small heat shock protein) n=1 Tax=Brachyspira hampsonii 30446 TaxID=1289135 RepID=A0A2U4FRY3_9SPIR|nr:Hsp20/alpha crystallin family protein [Brachyspira hampsonii]EKV58023.1 putative molecular chaperone, IbpA (small heat shock protein) [Brachyspira hampsonii 30446]MBW5389504.1 Hsp20/alpha crystallin family protein [Brachyspira hampsonii]MBW5393738.1 Hsp20/alpha crystallin family protein [Brachyspira hampsonii]OEJ20588.1 heat-shock protein Hsp20 [Brachyspira hampsonii]PTY41369.1 heat-shock protein Hsp20 [Brachyspira hampsonii bv. II]